jgi:hypothetical protein
MAHHCVQPWHVLAIQSPCAVLLGFALYGTSALCSGSRGNIVAHPVTAQPADTPVAMMKVRLVSLMCAPD